MRANHPFHRQATTGSWVTTDSRTHGINAPVPGGSRIRWQPRLARPTVPNLASLAVGASLLLTAACSPHGGSTPEAAGHTSIVSSAPTAEPSKAADAPRARVDAAVAAYRGLWHAYLTVLRQPDPRDPTLRQYASGDALAVFVDGLTSMRNQDLAGRGDIVLAPTVDNIEPAGRPTLVGVTDCVNSANSHLFKVDGSAYRDTPGGRQQVHATVQYLDGMWKVTEFALNPKVGSC